VAALRRLFEPTIYQLIIDGIRWRGCFRSRRLMMDHATLTWLRSRGVPPARLQRIEPYKDRIFCDEQQLARLLRKLLGAGQLARHQTTVRLVAQHCQRVPDVELGFPGASEDGRFSHDPRVQLCFTEAGWEKVGSALATQARRLGHTVSVRRQPLPDAARILCQDELQVLVQPAAGARRRVPQRTIPITRAKSGGASV
jgi:hypothetical protein